MAIRDGRRTDEDRERVANGLRQWGVFGELATKHEAQDWLPEHDQDEA